MYKAYKYRIYPTFEQRVLIAKHFGCARWVYNWALAEKIRVYQLTGESIFKINLSVQLPVLKKKPETVWLAEVNAQTLQSSLAHLDEAYTRFFRKQANFPKFKRKSNRQSFCHPSGARVDFSSNTLYIKKFKELIKIRISRPFTGAVKSVTISKSASNKYFASILVDDSQPLPAKVPVTEATTIGVDLGLTHFATLSTGEKIENPRHLKWSLRKLARLQRQHARKKSGSKNREKARVKVARCHERVANQRKDFLHKLSTRLIRENQAVAIEDLNIQGMVQNRKLAKSISDASWSLFVGMLKYKADWRGKNLLQIGRFEPSSKLCTCGIVNRELKLSDRQWTCNSCGASHDRDILAANNIKRMALHPLNFLGRGTPELTPVENLEQ